MGQAKVFEDLKNEIKTRIDLLQNPKFANYYNNPKLEIEVLLAIVNVIDEVALIDQTRWARIPSKSNKNLSWIFSRNINPVINNLTDMYNNSLGQIDALKISLTSNSRDIKNFVNFLITFSSLNTSESFAVAYLIKLSELLLVHYKSEKRKLKEGDYPYCKYCFRYVYRNNTDVCEKHMGVNRSNAKKKFLKYVVIKNAIVKYDKNVLLPNKPFNSLALDKLNQMNFVHWGALAIEERLNWIKDLLIKLDIITEVRDVNVKAIEILESSKDILYFFPNWPTALNGTMLRYQAYILATTRTPTKKMANRLDSIWSGKSITAEAKNHNLQRTGLQRQVSYWKKEITSLRDIYVPDEIIKLTFGLNFLPNFNKSRGAANKKSPQRF